MAGRAHCRARPGARTVRQPWHVDLGERHPANGKQLMITAPIWAREAEQAACVSWPGMFAHLMNEARDEGSEHNVCVTEPDGVVVATKAIATGTELLWEYNESRRR
jgi:hypothetical protein